MDGFRKLIDFKGLWLSRTERHFLKKSSNRLWQLRGATFASLILILFSAAFGFWQNTEALKQRAEAEKSQRLAQVVLAQAKAEKDPDEAIRLVLSAWPKSEAPDIRFAKTGLDAISSALRNTRPSIIFRLPDVISSSSISFSPDAKLIASVGGGDGTLRIWNLRSRSQIPIIKDSIFEWASDVAFSPNGKYIAIPASDFSIHLVNVTSGKTEIVLRGHTETIENLSFSPDGNFIASASIDATVRVWDVENGQQLKQKKYPLGFRRSV